MENTYFVIGYCDEWQIGEIVEVNCKVVFFGNKDECEKIKDEMNDKDNKYFYYVTKMNESVRIDY